MPHESSQIKETKDSSANDSSQGSAAMDFASRVWDELKTTFTSSSTSTDSDLRNENGSGSTSGVKLPELTLGEGGENSNPNLPGEGRVGSPPTMPQHPGDPIDPRAKHPTKPDLGRSANPENPPGDGKAGIPQPVPPAPKPEAPIDISGQNKGGADLGKSPAGDRPEGEGKSLPPQGPPPPKPPERGDTRGQNKSEPYRGPGDFDAKAADQSLTPHIGVRSQNIDGPRPGSTPAEVPSEEDQLDATDVLNNDEISSMMGLNELSEQAANDIVNGDFEGIQTMLADLQEQGAEGLQQLRDVSKQLGNLLGTQVRPSMNADGKMSLDFMTSYSDNRGGCFPSGTSETTLSVGSDGTMSASGSRYWDANHPRAVNADAQVEATRLQALATRSVLGVPQFITDAGLGDSISSYSGRRGRND